MNIQTYSTSEIAKIVGMHPNTVRKYEEWGLIQIPERKSNGYRVYKDIHIKQFELAKKAFQVEILQAGLRKRMIDVVKLSAQYRFDEAMKLVEEYIEVAMQEKKNAKEAAELCEEIFLDVAEDIIYACDKLMDSLDNARKNADDVIQILIEIKNMKK